MPRKIILADAEQAWVITNTVAGVAKFDFCSQILIVRVLGYESNETQDGRADVDSHYILNTLFGFDYQFDDNHNLQQNEIVETRNSRIDNEPDLPARRSELRQRAPPDYIHGKVYQ